VGFFLLAPFCLVVSTAFSCKHNFLLLRPLHQICYSASCSSTNSIILGTFYTACKYCLILSVPLLRNGRRLSCSGSRRKVRRSSLSVVQTSAHPGQTKHDVSWSDLLVEPHTAAAARRSLSSTFHLFSKLHTRYYSVHLAT
jgi:hypothetical protein